VFIKAAALGVVKPLAGLVGFFTNLALSFLESVKFDRVKKKQKNICQI
jgi:hypothetical protein